jgi:hypothetical protein
MNSIKLIKDIIKNSDPDLDISEGSGLNDILIKPLSTIMGYYHTKLGALEQSLTLQDIENMSEDELDALASNYLITRRTGNRSTGYVKISFDYARSLTLPINTKFSTASGKIFNTTRQYSISISQMTFNSQGGYYQTGAIAVEADEEGEDYTIGPNEINQIVGVDFDYVKTWNPSSFSRGEDSETNLEVYNRVLESATNETAMSELSIKKILGKSYTFKDITVKGYGDEEMLRDLKFIGVDFATYVKLDFFGKQRGFYEPPYNENIAGAFVVSGQEPPEISNVSLNELSNTAYQALYKKDNGLAANTSSLNVLDETFSGQEINQSWIKSDATLGKGVLKHPLEIQLDNETVRLGLEPHEVTATEVNVNIEEVQKITEEVNQLRLRMREEV